jgi:two-component system sensor histidine kinase HydH
MTSSEWVDLIACAGEIALAAVSFARVRRTPVAWPLGSFFVCVVVWSAAALLYKLGGDPRWTLVDHAASPFTVPLALAIALTFDGRRQALRTLLRTAYGLCGALSAVSVAALFVPSLRPFIGSRAWTAWMLSMGIPTTMFALVSFMSRLQRSVDRIEVERVRLALGAFAIAIVLGSTDVLTPLAPALPSLGRVGILIGGLAVALVSLRFSWFESPERIRRSTYALAAVGVALLVYVAVIGVPDATATGVVLGTVVVTVALIIASRRWIEEATLRRERVSQLATLGRFSAQLAHDMKNPLAALKGAAQLLRDDVAPGASTEKGRPGPTPDALVQLMLSEIDRLGRVIDIYGRLARVDLERAPVDLNEVVTQVIALQGLAGNDAVSLRTELAERLPTCQADRDMLASVLENLVRNGVEAMPQGGSVTIRTQRSTGEEAPSVVLAVEDTGGGMDEQTQERAFDDFFSTKPTGTGLGLAFVRRIIQAHGGEVSLRSSLGQGTVVRVRLPVSPEAHPASSSASL